MLCVGEDEGEPRGFVIAIKSVSIRVRPRSTQAIADGRNCPKVIGVTPGDVLRQRT